MSGKRPLGLAAGLVLGCLLVAPFLLQQRETAAAPAPALARQGVPARHGTVGAAQPVARHAGAASLVGGPVLARSGATVNVHVSASFPDAAARTQRWADFFGALPHGDELSTVAIVVVTAAELPASCSAEALGCYRPGQLIFADEVIDGVSPEEVARHEYGHHVAESRLNTPWPALDWGPKRWATAVDVCPDVQSGNAFPGDEGDHYTQNPAEAWAEAYRILAERSAGLPGDTWSIVVGKYYPDEAMLAAVKLDVLQPWTAPTTRRFKAAFARRGKRQWDKKVVTPLDGTIVVKLTMPVGPRHSVALYAADGRTLIARSTAFTSTSRTISSTICGQRSVVVRVTRGTTPTPFTVAVTAP